MRRCNQKQIWQLSNWRRIAMSAMTSSLHQTKENRWMDVQRHVQQFNTSTFLQWKQIYQRIPKNPWIECSAETSSGTWSNSDSQKSAENAIFLFKYPEKWFENRKLIFNNLNKWIILQKNGRIQQQFWKMIQNQQKYPEKSSKNPEKWSKIAHFISVYYQNPETRNHHQIIVKNP